MLNCPTIIDRPQPPHVFHRSFPVPATDRPFTASKTEPLGKIIVLVVAIAIIYYIGREVVGSFRHMTDGQLADYWAGRTKQQDPKAHRRYSEHLGSCDKCRDRLDEVRRIEAGPGADAPMIERKY